LYSRQRSNTEASVNRRLWLEARRRIADAAALRELFRHRDARPVLCPCCGAHTSFALFGIPPRLDARCPNCDSLERHRLIKLWLDANPGVVAGKAVLHFAPERVLSHLLRPMAGSYTGCDLDPAPGELKVDIEHLVFESGSFDLVICSHVLMYVDDRKALAELFRVLRGCGVLLVCIAVNEGCDTTHEMPERLALAKDKKLGVAGYRRLYGRDVRERMTTAGFTLAEYTAEEPLVSRHALLRGEKVFICRKPEARA
jgi:SAM-dependent methyltransferase